MDNAKEFTFQLNLEDDEHEKTKVTSTYDKPYPPIEAQNNVVGAQGNNFIMEMNDEEAKEQENLRIEVANKLVCPITKLSVFDTENKKPTVFGYPIKIEKDRFGRLWPTPVIEIISKEGIEYLTDHRQKTVN